MCDTLVSLTLFLTRHSPLFPGMWKISCSSSRHQLESIPLHQNKVISRRQGMLKQSVASLGEEEEEVFLVTRAVQELAQGPRQG